MSNISDAYIILFTDDVGIVHAVTFPKSAEKANARANLLLKALREIGLDAQKYGKYARTDS
ncbi:MAG: hypothetical protein WCA78_13970 [Rhizomicrobium sp.]